MDVGARIRTYRNKKKLSLMELSKRTGIAASNLSSMELGKSSPTLNTLIKIASAFNMRPGQFLEEAFYRKAFLCPQGKGTELKTSFADVSAQCVTGGASFNRIEAWVVRMSAASSYASGEGTDRFVYCLQGQLSATVEDESYVLRTGDSLYVMPDALLHLHNAESEEACVLVARPNRCED